MNWRNKFSQFFILVIASVLLFSCTSGAKLSKKPQDVSADSWQQLKLNLESGKAIPKAESLQIRKFNPFYQNRWIGQAVSYGCYRQGQAPWGPGPSSKQIAEDLDIISEYWHLLRVYNADSDTERILEVIKTEKYPIKMLLGVWLETEDNKPEAKDNNIKNVKKCLELIEKYPDIIIAVNVGNETQVSWSAHKMTQKNLVNYIRAVRNNTSLPVTTADDYSFWIKPQSKKLADEVDFIVSHMHPVWNGKELADAVSWLEKKYQEVRSIHPETEVVIGETGWATRYNAQKKGAGQQGTLVKGDVSLTAQGKFLKMLDSWVNTNKVTTFLFEAFDEPWKGGGENTPEYEIEKNWGVFYTDRTPKPSFQSYWDSLNNARN